MLNKLLSLTTVRNILLLLLLFYASTPTLIAQGTDFTRADSLALSVPDSISSNLQQIVAYLDKPELSDLEKARAAFRWITSAIYYDVDALLARWPSATPPSSVLKRKSAMCMGYANLLSALLDSFDIENRIVEGHAKGISFDRIKPELNQDTKHVWNLFKIDNQWHIADATFGSGQVDLKTKKFEKNFKPAYFDSSPEFFIYSHFPFQAKWQLLENPITKKEFLNLARITSSFEEYNLQFPDYQPKELKTSKETDFTIIKPQNVQISAALLPSQHSLSKYIVHLDDSFSRIYQNFRNIKIKNKDHKTEISMIFHEVRLYTLYIYARTKKISGANFELAATINFKNSSAVSKNNLLQ